MNEENNINSEIALYTTFISAWNYQILSFILLCTAIIVYFIGERVFAFGLILATCTTEALSFMRKRKLSDRQEEENGEF